MRILYAPSWKNAVEGYISRISRQKCPRFLPEGTKYDDLAIFSYSVLFIGGASRKALLGCEKKQEAVAYELSVLAITAQQNKKRGCGTEPFFSMLRLPISPGGAGL